MGKLCCAREHSVQFFVQFFSHNSTAQFNLECMGPFRVYGALHGVWGPLVTEQRSQVVVELKGNLFLSLLSFRKSFNLSEASRYNISLNMTKKRFFLFPVSRHVPYGLCGLPSRLWPKCNRFLRLGGQ
jgi:hypothetical protein